MASFTAHVCSCWNVLEGLGLVQKAPVKEQCDGLRVVVCGCLHCMPGNTERNPNGSK